MGRIINFDVQLKSCDGVLYPGRDLVGTVCISVIEGDVKVTNLQVDITGEARTAWINKASDKIFETREPYLDKKLDLEFADNEGKRSAQAFHVLGVGTHTIPFSSTTPEDLPPSFEGEFGYIRYTCVAHLVLFQESEFTCYQADVRCEKLMAFVCDLHPPSFIEGLKQSQVRDEVIESVTSCFRKGDAAQVRFSVDQSSFYVGGKLTATVAIRNRSQRKLKRVQLSLMQHARFLALSRYESVTDSRESTVMVDCVILNKSIPGGALEEWQPEMTLGQLTASYTGQLIAVAYSLRLTVGKADLTFPINIAWPRSDSTPQ